MTNQLTQLSINLFISYANDACNWGGTPMIGGNVEQGLSENGSLSDLKKKGLIKTFESDGNQFIQFTKAGIEFAASLGIEI